jgi:Holliday junction DNA helicase RuvB
MLTALAFQHLGMGVPQGFMGLQASLFEEPAEDET